MRIAILSNHRSGRGRAGRVALRLQLALHDAGHTCWQAETVASESDARLPGVIRDAQLVIVCGGDGSLRTCARAARDAGAMLWHAAAGTENLFARHFGMRGLQGLMRGIEAGEAAELDVWGADGHAFLVMASVGLDADIVCEVAARRRGPQARRHWVAPIVRGALGWRAPECTVASVDGSVVSRQRGSFIAANLPAYAARMNPVVRAEGSDGALDALTLRCRGALGLVPWAARGWMGLTGGSCMRLPEPACVVQTDRSCLWQIDGCPLPGGAREAVELRRDADRIRVLLPG